MTINSMMVKTAQYAAGEHMVWDSDIILSLTYTPSDLRITWARYGTLYTYDNGRVTMVEAA